jgi:biotin synthase-related radical SAM superfamily protein
MRMAEAQQELESRPVPARISKMIKDNWKSTAEQMLADEKLKETAAAAAAARGSTDMDSSTVYTRSAMYALATSTN